MGTRDGRFYAIERTLRRALIESEGGPERYEQVLVGFMRGIWHLYLNPPTTPEECDERFFEEIIPLLVTICSGELSPADFDYWRRVKAGPDVGLELRALLESFDPAKSFGDLANESLPGEDEHWDRAISQAWASWKPRIAGLSPSLIGSVRTISQEYLEWLSAHPDALDHVAWEAFERIVAEILASRGFRVCLTGRMRNRSADLIALRQDEVGIETRYLVECKRYSNGRRVGLDVVNGVMGSARRAGADHCLLVTSSSFSTEVEARESELRDLRLHLRDGDDIRQWLREYKPRPDLGLWLAQGWDGGDMQDPTRTE